MKAINFLGDSITEGAGASTSEHIFHKIVCAYFNAEDRNFGVGGTRIAKQTVPSDKPIFDEDFMQRAVKMPKNADFTFCFGGTNDYGHGDAPLGRFGDRSPYTFYGALCLLVEYLVKEFGKNKICFILPLQRFNQNNLYGDGRKKSAVATLAEYKQIEKEVFDFYKVDYLNCDDYFPQPQTASGDELTVDGLHPNDKGHKLLADLIIDYLLKKGYKPAPVNRF